MDLISHGLRPGLAGVCACLMFIAAVAPGAERSARPAATDAASLLKALGIPCEVSGALRLAATATTDGRGRQRPSAGSQRYEVSCEAGLGYLLTAAAGAGAKPTAEFCFEPSAVTPPDVCILPGNDHDAQRAVIGGLLRDAGVTNCSIDRYRFAGRSVIQIFFEVACSGADGFLLIAGNPLAGGRIPRALPCIALPETGQRSCQLTDRKATIDAMIAGAERQFVRDSGRVSCKLRARRYVLTDSGGNSYYEFLCQDGANYLMVQLANGSFGGTDVCSGTRANELGGCQLSPPPR
jgi:hypothetical protein